VRLEKSFARPDWVARINRAMTERGEQKPSNLVIPEPQSGSKDLNETRWDSLDHRVGSRLSLPVGRDHRLERGLIPSTVIPRLVRGNHAVRLEISFARPDWVARINRAMTERGE
jgi:hypothetical protein